MDLIYLLGQQAIRFSGLVGAVIAITGTLYLAYDLFGQRHGPLRILSEAITYVIIGMVLGSAALGCIAFDAVFFDPYFVRSVTEPGAISVLLAFGATGGIGGGLGYVLTIERRWKHGQPKLIHLHPAIRVAQSLALGIFEGILVYVVMANFRHTHDVVTGILWGTIDGVPWGLLFGFLLAYLLVEFSSAHSAVAEGSIGEGDVALLHMVADDGERGASGDEGKATPRKVIGHLYVRIEQVHANSHLSRVLRPSPPIPPFDVVGFLSGIATGVGIGPVTALSYFALYGPFVPRTFALITLAGLIGGLGLGICAATAERVLIWIDRLPPKKLGLAGAFLVVMGFLFQAAQQVAQIITIPVLIRR